jgi:hypothetical protein
MPKGIFSISPCAGALIFPHKFLKNPPTLPQNPGFFGFYAKPSSLIGFESLKDWSFNLDFPKSCNDYAVSRIIACVFPLISLSFIKFSAKLERLSFPALIAVVPKSFKTLFIGCFAIVI